MTTYDTQIHSTGTCYYEPECIKIKIKQWVQIKPRPRHIETLRKSQIET